MFEWGWFALIIALFYVCVCLSVSVSLCGSVALSDSRSWGTWTSSCVGIIDMSAILRTILHPLANVRDKRTVLEDIPALDVTIQKPIKSQPSTYSVLRA